MRNPTLIQIDLPDPVATRKALLAGLLAPQAVVAPKYFYDALGARLFAAITELPEYYPTRTEAAIFAAHAGQMARHLPHYACLVDLGAGNCEKAARLFEAFSVAHYVAVDLSVDYLRQSLELLQQHHPTMALTGVGLDFSERLVLPPVIGNAPRLMFYPGSSIGNFTPAEALIFLRQVHAGCCGGGLLIGVDLVKPRQILERAYDDPLQVTAAFNRNLLRHLQRLTGASFAIDDWRHVALFNAAESRIEMHLEAMRALEVSWPEGGRQFAAGERIHTENSYKWRVDDFAALLTEAGFSHLRHWTDAQGWFAVFIAAA